ncbi:MAG TPA: hypothetical protein PKE55_10645 [Kiritimatiellia bacterium]|nr:hypothetical protein [Kiritimatiellia bacterium]
MKPLIIILAGLISFATLHAQPPHDPNPAMARPGLEQWLERLRERDPQEHQRLLELQQSDPSAFREEIAERVRGHRHRVLESRPVRKHLHQRYGLDALIELQHALEQMRREQRETVQPLLRAYRAADNPAEQTEIRAKLREELRLGSTTRLNLEQEALLNLRSFLDEMDNDLHRRKNNQEIWVEKRLEELLSGPPSRPPRQP